ncbi:presequence protease, mitochondrial-like isoform X11 [Chlorocebus sabaeus]|uniref:presequence protease, mitochondrial-like isoform X3 n=1 Tax=Chlorocebus sabaeus TaxID=60711 RepID=UPI003BF95653
MWANASELSPTRTQILPGMDHFLYGLSDEMKQAHREQLFTISHKKLLAMSDRYLGTGKSTHGLAILRPENPKIAKDPSWIIRPCGSVLLTDGSSTGRPDGSSPEKQVGWALHRRF